MMHRHKGRMITDRQKYKAFALLELMFALLLLAGIVVAAYAFYQSGRKEDQISTISTQIAEFTQAVELRVAKGDLATSDELIKTSDDLSWLKANTCPDHEGSADMAYLPCDFSFDQGISMQPITLIIKPLDKNARILLDIKVGPFKDKKASKAGFDQLTASEVFTQIKADLSRFDSRNHFSAKSFVFDANNASFQIHLILTKGATIMPDQDIYLHNNGSNQMEGNLNFSTDTDADKRAIRGSSRIEMAGNSTTIDFDKTSKQKDLSVDAAKGILLNADEGAGTLAIDKKTNEITMAHNKALELKSGDSAIVLNDDKDQSKLKLNAVTLNATSSHDIVLNSQGGLQLHADGDIDFSQSLETDFGNDNALDFKAATITLDAQNINLTQKKGNIAVGENSKIAGISNVVADDVMVDSLGTTITNAIRNGGQPNYVKLETIPINEKLNSLSCTKYEKSLCVEAAAIVMLHLPKQCSDNQDYAKVHDVHVILYKNYAIDHVKGQLVSTADDSGDSALIIQLSDDRLLFFNSSDYTNYISLQVMAGKPVDIRLTGTLDVYCQGVQS
ncbi:MAG: hypothetical protein ACO2ZM_06080 [Francisellaceae bacterium]